MRMRAPLLAFALTVVGASGVQGQVLEREYATRRAAFAERMQDGFMVLLGAEEPDHDYEDFAQAPPFRYLTGIDEPGAALVLIKSGGRHQTILFVQPKDPAREVWSGARIGVDGAAAQTGLRSRLRDDFEGVRDSLARVMPRAYVARPTTETALALRRAAPEIALVSYWPIFADLRGIKSPAELDLLRKAIAITVDAHEAAARTLRPGMNEFEMEALVEYTFRRNGANGTSFASIIGSGPNSTTLHYNRNDRFMNAGELVVMDIGASYRGYAADVTRTLPVSGRFSPDQREVYQIVRDAQAAAERAAVIGAPAMRTVQAADSVIKRGLARLGLIESPDATYDCGGPQGGTQCMQYRLYYMHGLGHAIGLEVHDPGTSGTQAGAIAVGDAFTIEPGIYVRWNLLGIIPSTPRNESLKRAIAASVQRYANIGVRIEDDYLATAAGVEWVSRAPREIGEIEALMRRRLPLPGPRDPVKVEWYRATTPPLRGTP